MSRASTHAGIFFFLVALLALPLAQAQTAGAKKFPIKIIYSALTASNAPVWVAGDQGLYDKYGLDVQIVHGRGASPIQALAGGTVELGHFAGASVIVANLAGSDLVFVAAQSNYVVLSMWTKKDSPVKPGGFSRKKYWCQRARLGDSYDSAHHAQEDWRR